MPDDRVRAWVHPAEKAFHPRIEWTGEAAVAHPEHPARAAAIEAALRESGSWALREAPSAPVEAVAGVHDPGLLALYDAVARRPPGEVVLPTAFPRPMPGQRRMDPENLALAGAWCFDTGTPLDPTTRDAAFGAAGCALAAAADVRAGARLAYALCRPPGHHASAGQYGGYCFLNNAALAARALRPRRRVAVLDLDVHHGNGTQAIFWRDPRVFFASIHEHPDRCFPYVAGLPDEVGEGPGCGTTLNVTEEAGCDGRRYVELLEGQVVPALLAFRPHALVLSAGLDTYALDPIGRFALTTDDFAEIGGRLRRLGLPTVVVQEGGYHVPHLGRNALALLEGLRAG